MKIIYNKLTVLACIAAFSITSCDSTSKQNANEVEKAAVIPIITTEKDSLDLVYERMDTINEYAKYKRESDALIKDNELKIAQLKAKVITDKREVRLDFETKLNLLEKKNTQLKIDMLDYQGIDRTEWEKFKLKFNQDMDMLKLSISMMAEKAIK